MPMEKTFDAATAEARIYTLWQTAKAFRAGANARAGAKAFSIMIPPPNVTGSLHMGHAFNVTLQDILIRWHRMQGDDTLWQVGTDHAGIATQMVVERDLARSQQPTRREMGREAFLEKVWEWKAQSGDTIKNQLQRLGASCDWDREAFTMSGNFPDAVIKVFVDMYSKGLIYRGKRLVNWDPHFETAISDLEVENIEVAGHMWHFKYLLADGETYEYIEKDAEGAVTLREMRNYISIATTRPETMLGDGAVAVHPSDTRYAPIVGRMVHLPLCDRLIPIITDEYPDPNFGSGAVKITGAHDFNDYAVAKRAGIPCYRLMDTRAAMRTDGFTYEQSAELADKIASGAISKSDFLPATDLASVPWNDVEEQWTNYIDVLNLVPTKYRGLDRFEARKQIVADINALGLCVSTLYAEIDPETGAEHLSRKAFVEEKKIMQPFGDRSKVVIEPMLTDQWFVDTAKIVGPALDAVRSGATRIIPESGEKTYFHWLENIEPWCISRQLWWGHQIPVWYGPKFSIYGEQTQYGTTSALTHNQPFVGSTPAEIIQSAKKLYGPRIRVEIQNDLDNQPLFENLPLGGDQDYIFRLRRDPDVLDTWFSSGLWPIGTLGWPDNTPELQRYFPTSTLITGSDIIFFWVARMMMMQLAVVGDVPFKDVYLHGLVRDAKGKKMSKSLGNVIDPLDIIDQFGTDALRFANASMASLGGVLKLDTQRIAGYRNFGTKLWNACRFAELNRVWEGHATGPAPNPKATVNRWIIGEAAKTRIEVDAALAGYRFDQAANALYSFVWGRVCDWYVEFAKPLFDGPEATETRQTMAWVLDQCMILLHPMMPFITEDLWSTTGQRAKLLVHADWPHYGAELIDPVADAEMTWVTTLIDEIRSVRAQMHVPVGLKLDMLSLGLTAQAQSAYDGNAALIHRLARIERLTAADRAPKGAITLAVDGATFALPLADVIDVAEEKARLVKSLDKLAKEIIGLNGRLNNPNFAASAPEDVVDEARANLAARADEAGKLNAALKRLAEIG